MNSGIAAVIGFIGGSAVGGGLAYYFTKKKCEKKCLEEIAESREIFRNLKEEALAAQREALAAKETAEKSEARASRAEQTLFELNKHKDSKDWLFGGINTHKTEYSSASSEPTNDIPEKLNELSYATLAENAGPQKIFKDPFVDEEKEPTKEKAIVDEEDEELEVIEDPDMEIEVIESMFPSTERQLVIDPELFGVIEEYDMICLTRYADGIFSDDKLMKVDESKIFKSQILREINECGDESICVQDNEQQIYYEIILEKALTYKKAIT